jgi:hypothetical protein
VLFHFVSGFSSSAGGKNDIRSFFPFLGKGNVLGNSNTNSGNLTSRTFIQPSHKPQYPLPKSNTNNIMGFRDLYNKNINAGASCGKQNKTDFTNASQQNGGLLPRSSPKKPLIGSKAHTPSSSEDKDNVRTGKFGGTLANRGGGTLVITAKASNKGVSNDRRVNGNSDDGKKLINNFVAFSGMGHTLAGETTGTVNSRKSQTVTSHSLKSPVLLKAPSQAPGSRTSHDKAKVNKRYGSLAENDVHKKHKNGSSFNLTAEGLPGTNSNTVKCPVCSVEVGEHYVNTHLDSCLGTTLVDDCSTATKDCSVKSETDSSKIKCPACDSEMLKCDLNAHLDICLGAVFCSASIDDDYDDDGNDNNGKNTSFVDLKPESSAYSCPCCGMFVMYAEMNRHLDHCLTGME